MAASTKHTSVWVSSYSDKKDEWVQARLEHLEGLERLSLNGSIPRRKEIRTLRVELINRRKKAEPDPDAADLPAQAATNPLPPKSSVAVR